MGVQGLWSLVGPAARPTQLESLRQKKIAVDASIWIHQFMRTMRDKEGNALRNGHLLGFFRRICKLLFFDIKPVFVFDGGAPSLKRTTIVSDKRVYIGVLVFLTDLLRSCREKEEREEKVSNST
jgi:DNA excision repair protein ERCC-5